MSLFVGGTPIPTGAKLYVATSPVSRIYAGANLAWQAGDTAAPSVPTGLVVTGYSYYYVSLSWNASTDDVGVAGYKVYRSGTLIGTTTSASYSDTTVNASSAYSYSVAAYDAAGNTSGTSLSVSQTTSSAPYTPPPKSYPYTVGTINGGFIPVNGSDSAGYFTKAGTYSLGSLSLSGELYRMDVYWYCGSDAPYPSTLYSQGYVIGYVTGAGQSSPSTKVTTSNSGTNWTSSSFRYSGTANFNFVVADSWYSTPAGNPMVTITAIGA